MPVTARRPTRLRNELAAGSADRCRERPDDGLAGSVAARETGRSVL